MDRSLKVRERIAIGAVATAFGLALVTTFLPFGFWSTAPRGYVIGVAAATPGLLLGYVDTSRTLCREVGVDVLLSAVLGWFVGTSVVVHGELVVGPGGAARAMPLELLGYHVVSAVPTYMALGSSGFVVGTAVGVVSRRLRTTSLDGLLGADG